MHVHENLDCLYLLNKYKPNTQKFDVFLIKLYFMNEKFNKNAKVEQLTKMLGRGVHLIVILPLECSWWWSTRSTGFPYTDV